MSRARREFIQVIVGIIMMVTGVCLFLSKAKVYSAFLESSGIWQWWMIVIAMIPLIAGIVLLIIRPHLTISKIVAAAGVLVVLLAVFLSLTIVIVKPVTRTEWIVYGILVIGGLVVSSTALLLGRKK